MRMAWIDCLILQIAFGLDHNTLFVLWAQRWIAKEDVGSHIGQSLHPGPQRLRTRFHGEQHRIHCSHHCVEKHHKLLSQTSHTCPLTWFCPKHHQEWLPAIEHQLDHWPSTFRWGFVTTFWKAEPLHCSAALGASWFRNSAGQMPARNSNRFVYSASSVSPGSKLGIRCQGRCDADPVVDPCPDVGPGPASSGMVRQKKCLNSLGSTPCQEAQKKKISEASTSSTLHWKNDLAAGPQGSWGARGSATNAEYPQRQGPKDLTSRIPKG